MAVFPEVPLTFRAVYKGDGSAKATFLAEMASISTDAKRQFETAFGEIGSTITKSLSGFRNGGFKFEVDLSGLRQAATEADFTAQRLTALRDAAIALAAASGDNSQATQSYVQALRAQVVEANRARDAAAGQVDVYTRLQGEIDKTAASNTRLAESYRATFLEQAKAANAAFEYQQKLNSGIGLSRTSESGYGFVPSKSARDSASVFESQSYAPKADTRSGLDRLLAGQASIDRAALSGVTLEQVLGRVASKGREVATALDEAERAAAGLAAQQQKDLETNLAKAAADAKAYAAGAAQLRAQLDPAVAIQQKFDAELENADRLLAAGAISQKEYAQATALARNNLAESWTALTRTQEENERVTKRGTSETGNVINGIRAQRVAFTQLGQQLQDVVVQTQMGTNATTIFVQQVPQMAFALSGLAENSNQTYSRIGKFASFLAGPWGAAIFAATAVLGPLIAANLNLGDAVDEALAKLKKDASETEATREAKERFKTTLEGVRAAILDQKEALDKQSDSLRSEAEKARDAAKANLAHEISIRNVTLALLEQAKARAERPDYTGAIGGAGVAQSVYAGQVADLQKQAEDAAAKLKIAQDNLTRAQSFVDTEAGKNAADPAKVIEDRYKRLIEQARLRAVAEGKVGDALKDQVKALEAQKKAALDALRDSSRHHSSGLSGREITSDEAKSIAQRAGFQVNSSDRTYAQQKALYDKWVAAGKPSDNPVAKPGTSAHERGNALDIQYGAGVTPESIRKAFADEGVRLTKLFKERGHFHVEWSTSGADKVQREADQLAQFGQRAAESIARINDRFNEQPRLVDAAAAASRELDKTIADLAARKPPGFEQMISDAEKAKGVIEDALVRPYRELARDTDRRLQVQDLLSQGRETEAAAVQEIWRLEQQLGPLTTERKADVIAITAAEQAHIEKLRVAQEIQSAYLDATRSVRSEVEAIVGGYGKLSNLRGVFQQLQGKIITEKLFGDVFRDMDKWVKEKTGIGSSVDMMAKEVDRAGQAANTFADKLTEATAKLNGAVSGSALASGASQGAVGSLWSHATFGVPSLLARPQSAPAANDNAQIVVVANKPGKSSVNDLTPERYFEQLSAKLTKPIVDALERVVGPGLAKSLGSPIAGALEGYLTTGTGFGAVLGGLKDLKGLPDGLSKGLGKLFGGAQTGALVSGIGNALGLGLSNTGSQIGGAIGSLIPIPGGDIIGSIAGGLIGKLFGKRPRGGGAVTQNSLDVHANDDGITSALGSFGTDLQSAISKIANALGGEVGSYNVGIGRYKDYYQVSGVGNDPRLGNSYFGRDSANALYDGKDPEEAMRAAILNALQDGAIKGVREGTKRLLAAGKDLDAQIQKAVDFENVFKELKRISDPVGAALDEVNAKFTKLKATFIEAGASAAEMADLEKLYGIQRVDAIKKANEQVIGSLKDLKNSLTIGNDALSLRDRKAAALAEYTPLEARVRAGDVTAYDEYAKSAQQLLDIERQMSGSQGDYFALLDKVTSLLNDRINAAQSASDAATNRDNPFSGTSTSAANDNAGVKSALDALGNRLIDGLGYKLDAVNENLGTLIQRAVGNTGIVPDYSKIFGRGGTW